ncbi:META domain-containing protein [Flavobacterium sp. UBA6135]|uniref:META domain-containing protein n=1 Tax=Flavobacterium sp. UBA6135 TaxID=1946553 RepID=UPI0025BB7A18|nr:META domain-containing protein [Flavobacterium sp. UBA6135]
MKKLIQMSFVTILIVSCTTKLKSLPEIPEDEIPKKMAFHYFSAIGTEPFWSLEISESLIKFSALDENLNFNAPYVEPIRAMDSNVKMYRAETESGKIEITIIQEDCSDNMSEKKYYYKVEVTIQRGTQKDYSSLKGCGNYTFDYRLHDIWVLEEVEGKTFTKDFFLEELPFLEINSNDRAFSGFGGCNRIRGKLFQERELLRFYDIASSKMMCDSKNKEGVFIKALTSATTYEIKNNRLYLSNPDGMKLIMKKVD